MFASVVLRRVSIRQESDITWERCRQRVKDGTFDLFSSRICRVKDYDTVPALVVEGEKTAKYRVTHAPYGIVNVYSRKCSIRVSRV